MLGLVSTPAGGAYEWQWYATGVDRVPAAILAAAARTTIAIVDTGADLSAPSLAGKVRASYDVRTGGHAVDDASGHGTFVASIAGGSTAAGGAVAGFGGAARLLVVKVGAGTTVSDVDVAAGIVRSVQSGARIVNVSIAGPSRSAAEASAVAYAARHGALVVAAAGNDALAGNPAEYPAALLQPVGSNGVGGLGLAVAASGPDGRRAPFSEHGSFLSLAAPGTAVFGALASRARAPLFAPRRAAGRCRGALRVRERHLVCGAAGLGGGRARLGGESAAHAQAGRSGARADGERPRRLVSGARLRRDRRAGCDRSRSAPRSGVELESPERGRNTPNGGRARVRPATDSGDAVLGAAPTTGASFPSPLVRSRLLGRGTGHLTRFVAVLAFLACVAPGSGTASTSPSRPTALWGIAPSERSDAGDGRPAEVAQAGRERPRAGRRPARPHEGGCRARRGDADARRLAEDVARPGRPGAGTRPRLQWPTRCRSAPAARRFAALRSRPRCRLR